MPNLNQQGEEARLVQSSIFGGFKLLPHLQPPISELQSNIGLALNKVTEFDTLG